MEVNNNLIFLATEKAKNWLSDLYDGETRKQVQQLLDNEDKNPLIDAFYKDLEFGTGGLRGIMGVGTNRLNKYTIGTATQGMANYLKKEFKNLPQIKVAISHDSRLHSREYAVLTAEIFSANGIKAYIFEDLRPIALESFAVRELGCQGGVMITASHNPKEYNGYKVYWNDGAQVVSPHDKNIIAEVNRVTNADVKFNKNEDLIETINPEIEKKYIQAVKSILLSPEIIKEYHDLPIVYTPIHGSGVTLVGKTLKGCGFTNIIDVPEQNTPDGNFPTVKSPNPENPEAMKLAVERAKATNAEIAIGTDPDADRYAIAVRDENGEYILLNGNQSMLLLVYYIITRKKELNLLTDKDFMVRTIVTSELGEVICHNNGVEMFETYTGFKWIASVIRELESSRQYIGGGEESFGFLIEDFVRDKDAVSAAVMCAEITAWAKSKDKSVYQILKELYLTYGFSKEVGISLEKYGPSGAEEIENMMKQFRENPPVEIGNSKVILIKDFATLKVKDVVANEESTIKMPTTSNVLQFFTEDKTKISVRPSGTEPKIKFYIEVKGKMNSIEDFEDANAKAEAKIELVKKDLGI